MNSINKQLQDAIIKYSNSIDPDYIEVTISASDLHALINLIFRAKSIVYLFEYDPLLIRCHTSESFVIDIDLLVHQLGLDKATIIEEINNKNDN